MAATNTENIKYFKTAELVRDELGCYYFVCLQCYENYENLDDIVSHIEKYFNDLPDDIGSEKNLLTPMVNDESQQTAYQQQQCMNNDVYEQQECMMDSDVLDFTKIKDEPLDEYEDYKLTSQQICEVKNQTLAKCGSGSYCPICKKSFNSKESSLKSHLIRVHHRDKRYAKIYECTVCGRNTFTRPYDLKRHELIHIRESERSSHLNFGEAEPITDASPNTELRCVNEEQLKEDPGTIKLDVANEEKSLLINPLLHQQHESHDDGHFELPKVKEELLIEYQDVGSSRQPARCVKNETSIKCPICKKTVKSKEKSLKSHLIRVHHRNELHATIYECTFCFKNTFTRSYDLKRHEKIHIRKGEVPISNVIETSKANKSQHQSQRKKAKKSKTINHLQRTENEDLLQSHPIAEPTNSVTSNDFLTTDPIKTGISCVYCSKTFGSYLDVTNHLKTVHNETRVYKCGQPNCVQDSFISAFELHRHEMSHSHNFVVDRKKRMNCVFCSRSFNKKWNLMKHEKRHLLREYKESASKATF